MLTCAVGMVVVMLPPNPGNICSPAWTKRIGMQARVNRADPVGFKWDLDGLFYNYMITTEDGLTGCCDEGEIRPVYDGNQKVTWAECAWRPNEVKA